MRRPTTPTRIVLLVASLALGLGACGGSSTGARVTPQGGSSSATSSGLPKSINDCGVTQADVQAVLPANTPAVHQNTTPDPSRCNFTWTKDGAAWGIDVLVKRGGRAQIEASPQYPAGPDKLKNGAPYETVTGLGDKAWASGNAHNVGLVVIKGNDVLAVGISFDESRTPPNGPRTAKGFNADWLAICKNLAIRALT